MSAFTAPHFQSHEAARKYLEGLRWGGERVCPHCGTVGKSYVRAKKPGLYRCATKECRKDFTVTTKSVMESSHIQLHVWLQAFYLMASSKKGVSAHQLHRTLGITYKSAWFLTHRIRDAMRAGNTAAARRCAEFAVEAHAVGKGFPTLDGSIAAIVAVHGFAVASRKTTALNTAGLTLIDPWTVTS